MTTAIAFGSNLGDRVRHLSEAKRILSEKLGAPTAVSPLFETSPVGCEENAGAFLNAVALFDCRLSPHELLAFCRSTEIALGRPKHYPRHVSRPIDLDILFIDDIILDTKELTIPHPLATSRRFVLKPLAAIDPNFIFPGQSLSIKALLEKLPDGEEVKLFISRW